MKLGSCLFGGLMIGALSFCGCNDKPAASPSGTASTPDKTYLLTTEPTGAKGVKQARAESKDAEEVTIVGRIGGDEKPWIEGQAAFLLVDTSLKPCNERPGDDCPIPWDYCCDANELPTSKAMVKIVDGSGKTVATDARKLLGVKELQTLVVHGKAKRDDAGNLTVLADKVFIRQ
jgi:hypothetical protein